MTDGKIVIETEIDDTAIDEWLNKLPQETKTKLGQVENRINSLSQRYGELAEKYLQLTNPARGVPIFKSDAKEAERLKKELKEVTKELEKLTGDKIIGIKGITDLSNETSKLEKTTISGFKKMSSTIRTFGWAIIGIRSAYALVSKASSAYLAQDTELAEKLKSVWVGLGSFLAPLIEAKTNSLLKALGYLNVFIKALTGIDYLARANAKALKQQASAQKELNNQTYDFDVIRTQQDTSSSGGGGISGGDLFQIPELDENIVKKLQEMAKWLKENWNWIKKVGEILLITFGAVKIAQVLTNIGKLLGVAGLGGLSSALSAIATVGVITLGVYLLYTALTGRDLIEDLKNIKIGIEEVKQATENNTKADKQQTEGIRSLTDKMKKANEENKLEGELLNQTTRFLKDNTKATVEQVRELNQNVIKTKEMKEQQKALKDQMDQTLDAYRYLYEQGKLNEEQTADYIDALDAQIQIMEDLGYDTSDLRQEYEKLTGQQYTVKVDVIDHATSTLDKIIDQTLEWLGLPNKKTLYLNEETGGFGAGSGGGGFRYAQGGIVTQPTRALIGEAGYPEAVVPMTQDYLSTLASEISRYGNGGSGVVNIYLDGRLIQRQISNTETRRNFVTNR